ncbi:hypothetical protein DLAC_02027 [Tieghemostelium lacteum]|uniref:Pyridoxal phosphate homeostasis protein n=1 Tax=Tieghemostelium lacteum TaxID=361077 RepID=A0A152A5E9_TIELA|nr:hypothetical protein DLAC_02027 [Tieghemostelium lacteum]|eukprot:KYR01307.1 hypothetical protein DLAC_02027 [Tieghemostelium lacteum]
MKLFQPTLKIFSSNYSTISNYKLNLKMTDTLSNNNNESLFNVNELIENYKSIQLKVDNARETKPVRLVAVSKTKPIEMIKVLYENGQRDFGENYIQELVTKSNELTELTDIQWHFIGSIQSNKVKLISNVKNLYSVETIDRKEIIDKFVKSLDSLDEQGKQLRLTKPLNVMIQVNTSGEDSKSGCEPKDSLELVKYLLDKNSPYLKFKGLMTIGSPNASADQPDFKSLQSCKLNLSQNLNIPPDKIELSMGMSHDFEEAIKFGSTNVRVGSSIFGQRDYSKK